MTLQPRWRKVLRDLWGNKARSFLVILTIALGVFAAGFVSTSFTMVLSDMQAEHEAVHPSAATIHTNYFDDELTCVLEKLPGVQAVEGRSYMDARMLAPDGQKISLGVEMIPDDGVPTIDRLRPAVPGGVVAPLGERELYLERSVGEIYAVEPGDVVRVLLNDGGVRELRVADLVHDVKMPSYVFSGRIRTFVTPETMWWLGGPRNYTQVRFTLTQETYDKVHAEQVADAVGERVWQTGREVYFTYVPEPGEHWASQVTRGLAAVMSILGILTIFLSGFLVVNTITSLLGQHVQQIGMMKAVGAQTGQVMSMYLLLVLTFGLLAFCLSVPLSALASFYTAQGISGLLNFNLRGFRVPPLALALQAGVALCVPVGAALIPIRAGTRLTVREALDHYGLGRSAFGRGWLDRLTERVRGLPRPLLISLRNTCRRKWRLFLTLCTLTLGGAIFIAVFNLWGAFNATLPQSLGYFLADVNVTFDQWHRIQRLAPIVEQIPGVVHAEGWGESVVQLLDDGGETGLEVLLIAPPADSDMIEPVLTSGRWLTPEDENALVIGNHLLDRRPELQAGDTVALKVGERTYDWQIVGTYELIGNVVPPILYTNYEYLAGIRNSVDRVSNLRIVTEPHDEETQLRVMKALEARLGKEGIRIASMESGAQSIQQQTATSDIFIYFLLVMALLIALVGGLGLMGTMSMNVMERTREIGVMRSIGAVDGSIRRMVVVEGVLVGLSSWLLGGLLAQPISALLCAQVGIALMQSPMRYNFSWLGVGIWLVAVSCLSALASLLPARKATRLTIREVLAYE